MKKFQCPKKRTLKICCICTPNLKLLFFIFFAKMLYASGPIVHLISQETKSRGNRRNFWPNFFFLIFHHFYQSNVNQNGLRDAWLDCIYLGIQDIAYRTYPWDLYYFLKNKKATIFMQSILCWYRWVPNEKSVVSVLVFWSYVAFYTG